MNVACLSFRFSLRAMLLVIAAIAGFLGWRLWDFEKPTVAAIERDGGKVYFHYQDPDLFIGPGQRWHQPRCLVLELISITAAPATSSPPSPTLWEVTFGRRLATRVGAVDVPLEVMSPDMVARIKSLPDLQFVLVRTPDSVPKDSPEARRIAELKLEFTQKMFVTDLKR